MATSTSSSPRHDGAGVSLGGRPRDRGDDDLEAKERELAEQEEKLADYEKLVREREQLASEARKARLKAKEKKLLERKLELQKRFSEAVKQLEMAENSDEDDGGQNEAMIEVVYQGENGQLMPFDASKVVSHYKVIGQGQNPNEIIVDAAENQIVSLGNVTQRNEVIVEADSAQKVNNDVVVAAAVVAVVEDEAAVETEVESSIEKAKKDESKVNSSSENAEKDAQDDLINVNNVEKTKNDDINAIKEGEKVDIELQSEEMQPKKKRGRKRKHFATTTTTTSITPTTATATPSTTTMTPSTTTNATADSETPIKVPKKRGRKSKAELLLIKQQQQEQEPVKDPSPEPPPVQEGGRPRRRAAFRASQKVAKAINDLKSEASNDIQDMEGDEEDNFELNSDEVDLKEHYVTRGRGKRTYTCKHCDYQIQKKKDIEKHLLEDHAKELNSVEEEDEDEDDDEFNDDDDDSIGVPSEDFSDIADFDAEPKKRSRKSAAGNPNSVRAIPLEPVGDLIQSELTFRMANFNQNQFEEFKPKILRILDQNEVGEFMPKEKISPVFNGDQKLELFQSTSKGDFIFAGGQIRTSSFNGDYLALTASNEMIQIWSVENRRFLMGICHKFGKVNKLKFCPSANETDLRSGILSCAFADSTIKIFALPKIDPDDEVTFCSLEPNLILKVNSESASEVLDLDWFRGSSHKVIAGGFYDGTVALWDISSQGLHRSGSELMPYLQFRAHSSSVTALCLTDDSSPPDGRHPITLYTGSSDRFICSWDLTRTDSGPVQRVKRGFVKGIRSVPNVQGRILVSFDDVFLLTNTRTIVLDMTKEGKSNGVVCQNSAVWNMSYNVWLNTAAVCTSAGEVVLYVADRVDKSLENDKVLNKRRILLYRTEVDAEGRFAFADSTFSEEDQIKAKVPENMLIEDMVDNKRRSVRTVEFHPDPDRVGVIFAGGENGIGRIMRVKNLINQNIKKKLFI